MAERNGTEKERILVVDDERGIREGCRRILSSEGFEVETAENGVEGLSKAKEGTYDLIFIDLMMPGMGGMELLGHLRDLDPEIITIVITGYATVETAVEAMKQGAYDYIPKPFTPDQLMAVLNRGLETRRLRFERQRLLEERDKKLLEVANEKSQTRTIIGCMADGVLVVNREGQLVLWNPAAVTQLNLTNTCATGRHLSQYVQNEELQKLIALALSPEGSGYTMISQEIHSGDQGKKVLMADAAVVRDDMGETLGAVAVLQDISELVEIDRIKSQFVSMVAHELRAPLAAIEGYIDTCLTCAAGDDPETHRHMQERAKERAHALLELVNDLLTVSRIEAGKIAKKKEALSAKKIIESTLELLQETASKRGITVEAKITDDIPPMIGDRNDLERVLINLVSNAIKYNTEGGRVTVSVSYDDDFVVMRVADTGFGIPKEALPHIFDEFFRVEDEKRRYITGTGLGLSIVKKTVESHLGRIEVDSEPNVGSTFTVFIPRWQSCEKTTTTESEDSHHQ
jgi:two-component system phosphate regulon sensor histidine kinase PhoR